MKTIDIMQILFFLVVLSTLAIPLGRYMARVYMGEKGFLDRLMLPFEKLIYRICGVNETEEMGWRQYAGALLIFNLAGFLLLFILQLIQGVLPFNPQKMAAVKWDLALNTAISFMTNTNWQAYGGESTMSYFTQMTGMTVQNFVSAATGMAVAVALIRGLTRRNSKTLGNFWVDLTRSVTRILLPISFVLALVLVSQGVIQNLHPYQTVQTLEGKPQVLAMGPVASQEAIKELGTNGGGFMNANSAHPFENPTPLTNFLEMLAILVIPAALPFTFGHMSGDKRQGRAIFLAMLILFMAASGITYYNEAAGNPQLAIRGVTGPTAMEGKEVRFGIVNSALWSTVTTASSCGAVNSMHDSFTPLGGMIPLWLMMLGENVFGGVGSGLYGMLAFVIITIFIVGLMVGRTPEYLGKKIEAREMKMVTLAILIPAASILLGSATAAATPSGTASILNPGPHGLSEILYAFSSCTGNNGSAFAGLNANTLFYNLMLSAALLAGRFGVILPMLAVAGSMGAKSSIPAGAGTISTHNSMFVGLLIVTVIIVGALTFFPALALGPLLEQMIMLGG
ncbi:ATPase, K+ transporting, A subunit [Syntrophomonas zehnderi OL-4]|uniref:Potassium-transporting ATPase potassium-binding subunit n=1 Tax=Syntrophomonas zehnderi OL-4 TaxID=690567 RepID=A0A0E3W3M6_9FIRM|nr:potassium-transporting ATPase subunit KdpA [Syntrophomonas zehnderi]CFX93538.1 ATPase, K+ transporting, A subunit [Syntrophomonas zehnderi OL-4]